MRWRVTVASVVGLAACTGSNDGVVTPLDQTPRVRVVGYQQHVQIGDKQQLQVEVTGIENHALFFGYFTDEPGHPSDPSDKVVATLDATGNVSANSVGSVVFIARSQQYTDRTDTVRIYVDPPDPAMRLRFSVLAVDETRGCGVSTSGATYCWGDNRGSLLGAAAISQCSSLFSPIGDKNCNPLPVPVPGGKPFAQLVVGTQHTCGLADEGAVYCWGRNQFGEVGTGLSTPSLSPTHVALDGKVVSLSAAAARTCAVTEQGKLFCWGALRAVGFFESEPSGKCLPDGNCSLPTLVGGLPPVAAVSTSLTHTCALTREGAVYCWGFNFWGELGDGTLTSSNEPVRVASSVTFTSISTASSLTCALDADGRGLCWGLSGYPTGACGEPGIRCSAVPLEIEPSLRFRQISAKTGGACALTTGEQIYCVGKSPLLGLPIGSTITTLTPITPTVRFAALSVGSRTCAIAVDGLGYCWGENTAGESGTGQLRFLATPTVIEGPPAK